MPPLSRHPETVLLTAYAKFFCPVRFRLDMPRADSGGRGAEGKRGGGVADGEVKRDQQYITTRITADGGDGYPVEPGRYRLAAARACPWANRAVIVRRLLG